MAVIADNFGIGCHPGADADGLVAVLPCRGCGGETTTIREVCIGDSKTVAYWIYLCGSCRQRLDSEIGEKRKIFSELVADGRSVDLANEIMRRWYSR